MLTALLDTPIIRTGLPSAGASLSLFVVLEDEEAVRECVLEAGTGIFEGLENVSVVNGCSNILFNDAPFPLLTRPELSPLVFMLVIGPSTDFDASTGGVTPFDLLFSLSLVVRSDVLFCWVIAPPVVRLVRLGTVSEDEGRDFANELAVGASSVEDERFMPVLPVTREFLRLPLWLALLIRLFAVPLVLVIPRSSDSRFL